MPQHNQSKSWVLHLKLVTSAIDFMLNSDYETAASRLVKSLRIQHNHADVYFLLHLCEKQNENKSILLLNKAISMNPLCQIYDMQQEKALKKLKVMVKKSLDYQKDILNQNYLETSKWYNYTVYLHEQTDYQRVEEIYQRLFAKYPELYTKKSHAFLGNYANVLYDNGKYELALQKYEKQIELNSEQLRFFSNCAMLYTIVGNYKKAEEYINKALSGNPERSTFLFNYANILAKTHRYQESVAKIKQSINKQPKDPIFRVKLAITLLLWKQNSSISSLAIQNLKKAINVFAQSILKNNTQLTNCNKRILSMKNIICVRIFAEKLLDLIKYEIVWDRIKEFLEIFTDYLIVGQATKLQLNQKVRNMVNQTLDILRKSSHQEKLVEQFQNISMIGELKNETPEQKQEVFRKFFKSWSMDMNKVCNKALI